MSDIKQRARDMFGKGYYTFRFEYTDDGKRIYQIAYWNDGLPPEEALKNIFKHISKFPDGKLTDLVENEWVLSFIDQIIDLAIAETKENIKLELILAFNDYEVPLTMTAEEVREIIINHLNNN